MAKKLVNKPHDKVESGKMATQLGYPTAQSSQKNGGVPENGNNVLAESIGSRTFNGNSELVQELRRQIDMLLQDVASQKARSVMLEALVDDANSAIDSQGNLVRKVYEAVEIIKNGEEWKDEVGKVDKCLHDAEERLEDIPLFHLDKLKARHGQIKFRMMLMMADRDGAQDGKSSAAATYAARVAARGH